MRDSLIFYRSFYEALKDLPIEDKVKVYDAIFEYSLNLNSIELVGIPKAIFTLVKPQLDANNIRFENGKKGGRPAKKEPEGNQKITEQKPSDNQNETKTEPNKNVNLNNNPNSNENNNLNQNENDILLEKETKGKEAKEVDLDFVRELFNQYCNSLPRVYLLTDKRKKAITERLKEAKPENVEEFLISFFQRVQNSDFLSGRKTDWKADFDFIFTKSKFIKIIEGSYDNTKAKKIPRHGIDFNNPEVFEEMMRRTENQDDEPF